jgi:glycosyltransferase involved in cell wall biosynthesis
MYSSHLQDTDLPLVSIGVPLYNEERFLRDSLRAILQQDYRNLEIIISDNCSTDSTADICRELAAGDERVHIINQTSNVGAAANFVKVLEQAGGRYFMWASGHDLWSNNLVSEYVSVLESHPAAVIAYARSDWIGGTGERLNRQTSCYDTGSMNDISRFFMAFWGNMHPILGLIRMESLCQISKIHECAGTDQIILSELALMGEFLLVPAAHWSRRQPRDEETHRQKMRRYTGREYGLAGSWLDRYFPLLRLPLELIRVVMRSRLSLLEKTSMLFALPACFLVRYLAGIKR